MAHLLGIYGEGSKAAQAAERCQEMVGGVAKPSAISIW